MVLKAGLFEPFNILAAKLSHFLSEADGAHDIAHLARVWRNAKAIQSQEGGDLEILAAAVLLHDCVVVRKDSPLRFQASRLAATEATTQLTRLGWSAERAAWVAGAIESHSFSARSVPATLEARILQDADRLDAIGFIGTARCFYTAGRMGSSLYEASDPSAANRTLNDTNYALDHFPAKLLNLSHGFTTAAGRLLATQRHQAVRSFYDGMLKEISDDYD